MSTALEPLRDKAVLNVVTMDVPVGEPHVGGYLCRCEDCIKKNVTPIKRDVRQPWEPKLAKAA